MFSHRAATAALRAVGQRGAILATKSPFRNTTVGITRAVAAVHTTTQRGQASNKDKNEPSHAGSFARTDDSITVEYPQEHELPSSEPVTGAGRAGMHVYPTLATFSLEGNVGVVTGGARGLGLVMGQGMVVSGADLAIVDMNSEYLLFGEHAFVRVRELTRVFHKRMRLLSRPRLSWTSSRETILTPRSKSFYTSNNPNTLHDSNCLSGFRFHDCSWVNDFLMAPLPPTPHKQLVKFEEYSPHAKNT